MSDGFPQSGEVDKTIELKTEPTASITAVPLPNLSLADTDTSSIADGFTKKYVLGRLLGEGAFGIVQICTEKSTGNVFARKLVSKEYMTDGERDMVLREINIMNKLPSHANIVTLKETFEDTEGFHLVLDLCTGGQLLGRMKQKVRYTQREAASVMRDIVEGIKFCHEHGVMHRDLKPENIMYVDNTESSKLKIIDFGLSIIFTPGQRFYNEPVGTLLYSAPEVVGECYGQESDIWSAGVILYSLLSGTLPFYKDTLWELKRIIRRGRADFTRDPWPTISNDAVDLVKKMLHLETGSRLTAQQVLEHPWIGKEMNA